MQPSGISFLNRFFFGEQAPSSRHFSWKDDPYLNQEGVVTELIAPSRQGRVYCRGTLWPARCATPVALNVGDRTYVRGRDNITLLVEPIYPMLPATD